MATRDVVKRLPSESNRAVDMVHGVCFRVHQITFINRIEDSFNVTPDSATNLRAKKKEEKSGDRRYRQIVDC